MRCVIIAGSPDGDPEFIKQTVRDGDYIICADKGLKYAYDAGIEPDAAVGDFDSFAGKITGNFEIIRLCVHKNDTDTMHSVGAALDRGYGEIIILSSLGGRLDHTLSNIACLKYINSRGGKGCLLSKNERVELLSKGRHRFGGFCGRTFSLFPYGCGSVIVSYEGARYPLDSYAVKSDSSLGVSNVFVSDDAVIEISDGFAIVVINLSDV